MSSQTQTRVYCDFTRLSLFFLESCFSLLCSLVFHACLSFLSGSRPSLLFIPETLSHVASLSAKICRGCAFIEHWMIAHSFFLLLKFLQRRQPTGNGKLLLLPNSVSPFEREHVRWQWICYFSVAYFLDESCYIVSAEIERR